MLQRSLLASVVLLGGLHGNAAQSLGPWRIGQGRVMKNPFSPGCNLEHLRTTWMQETKLTAAFKGEERGGFRSRVLQSVSRSFPRAVCGASTFPLTVQDRALGHGRRIFSEPLVHIRLRLRPRSRF